MTAGSSLHLLDLNVEFVVESEQLPRICGRESERKRVKNSDTESMTAACTCKQCGEVFSTPLKARVHKAKCTVGATVSKPASPHAAQTTPPNAGSSSPGCAVVSRTKAKKEPWVERFADYTTALSRMRIPKKLLVRPTACAADALTRVCQRGAPAAAALHHGWLQEHVTNQTRVLAIGGLGVAAVLAKSLGASESIAMVETPEIAIVAQKLAADNGLQIRTDPPVDGETIDLLVLDTCDVGLVGRGCVGHAVDMCSKLSPNGTAIPAAVRAVASVLDVSLDSVSGFDLSAFAMPLRICPPRGCLSSMEDERCLRAAAPPHTETLAAVSGIQR
jgi:hypothetical protein